MVMMPHDGDGDGDVDVDQGAAMESPSEQVKNQTKHGHNMDNIVIIRSGSNMNRMETAAVAIKAS